MPNRNEPADPKVEQPVTRQIPGEMAPAVRTRARLDIFTAPTGLEPADNREKPPANSRMESYRTQSHLADGHADLKAFRREARSLSTAELRRRYPGEASSHAHMLGRARAAKAVIHPSYKKFKPFLLDAGPKPDPTFTFDRTDNSNPMYGPRLCEWRSPKEQARNRSTTIYLTDADGTRKPLAEWAEIVNKEADTLRWRYRQEPKWPEHEVIHGRGAAGDFATGCTVISPNWPAMSAFRKTARWDRAFGLFNATFAATGPATRPVMVAWFVGPHLRAHEAAYERDHGWDRSPDDVDMESAVLVNLRAAMSWARQRMTRDDRTFIGGYLDMLGLSLRGHQEHVEALHPAEVTRDDREELKHLQQHAMVADRVRAMLPTPAAPPPPPPAAAAAEPVRVRVAVPPAMTQSAFNIARQARADTDRARAAAAMAKAAAMDLPRIPDFEDYDTLVPADAFGVFPDDPDLSGSKARPVPVNEQDDAEG
jgi:hypothetical protein